MADPAKYVWRDFVDDGIASSGFNEPKKAKIRSWGGWIEAMISAGALGDNWKATKAALNADLAHAADSVAVVYNDSASANNGFYVKAGASGSGSWTQVTTFLPGYQFSTAVDDSTSTANNWNLTTSPTASTQDGASLICIFAPATNTSTTVLVSFDGNPDLTIRTPSGVGPAVGSLVLGNPIIGVKSGSYFITLSDSAVSSVLADLNAHVANNSNPHGVTAAQLGLGNVDDTADADKPISTAVASALAGKAPLASPVFTGTPTAPTPASATDNSTKIPTTAWVNNFVAAISSGVLSVNGKTGTVTLDATDIVTALGYDAFSDAGGTITGAVTINGNVVAANGQLNTDAPTNGAIARLNFRDENEIVRARLTYNDATGFIALQRIDTDGSTVLNSLYINVANQMSFEGDVAGVVNYLVLNTDDTAGTSKAEYRLTTGSGGSSGGLSVIHSDKMDLYASAAVANGIVIRAARHRLQRISDGSTIADFQDTKTVLPEPIYRGADIRLLPHIDVLADYGATGDGSTNDAAAINAAIADANTSGYHLFFQPNKNFKFTSALTPITKSGVQIIGGGHSTIMSPVGTFNDGIKFVNAVSGQRANGNKVRDIWFSAGSHTGNLFNLDFAGQFVMEDVFVDRPDRGLYGRQVHDIDFNRVKFESVRGNYGMLFYGNGATRNTETDRIDLIAMRRVAITGSNAGGASSSTTLLDIDGFVASIILHSVQFLRGNEGLVTRNSPGLPSGQWPQFISGVDVDFEYNYTRGMRLNYLDTLNIVNFYCVGSTTGEGVLIDENGTAGRVFDIRLEQGKIASNYKQGLAAYGGTNIKLTGMDVFFNSQQGNGVHSGVYLGGSNPVRGFQMVGGSAGRNEIVGSEKQAYGVDFSNCQRGQLSGVRMNGNLTGPYNGSATVSGLITA